MAEGTKNEPPQIVNQEEAPREEIEIPKNLAHAVGYVVAKNLSQPIQNTVKEITDLEEASSLDLNKIIPPLKTSVLNLLSTIKYLLGEEIVVTPFKAGSKSVGFDFVGLEQFQDPSKEFHEHISSYLNYLNYQIPQPLDITFNQHVPEFIAAVLQNINTPITTIISALQSTARKAIPDEQKKTMKETAGAFSEYYRDALMPLFGKEEPYQLHVKVNAEEASFYPIFPDHIIPPAIPGQDLPKQEKTA